MRFTSKRIACIAVIAALLATPGVAQAKKKKHKNHTDDCDITLTMTPDTGSTEVYEFSGSSSSEGGLDILFGTYFGDDGTLALVTGTVLPDRWDLTLQYTEGARAGLSMDLDGADVGEDSKTERNARGRYRTTAGRQDAGMGGAFTLHAVCTPS